MRALVVWEMTIAIHLPTDMISMHASLACLDVCPASSNVNFMQMGLFLFSPNLIAQPSESVCALCPDLCLHFCLCPSVAELLEVDLVDMAETSGWTRKTVKTLSMAVATYEIERLDGAQALSKQHQRS